jgi:hypothetical protein
MITVDSGGSPSRWANAFSGDRHERGRWFVLAEIGEATLHVR